MKTVNFILRSYYRDKFDMPKWHNNIEHGLKLLNINKTVNQFLEERTEIVWHPEQQHTDKIFVLEYDFSN